MRVCFSCDGFRGGGGGAGHLNTGNGFVNGISVNWDGSDFATGRAVTSAFFFGFGNGFGWRSLSRFIFASILVTSSVLWTKYGFNDMRQPLSA
jgi:hypothetical protein